MSTSPAIMSISLTPPQLKTYVKQRVKQTHYGTPSEYIYILIRANFKLTKQELIKGLNSGKSKNISPETWQQLRNQM